MEELTFKLEAFEGPLDLLLHLISKNKVDIYDIPIALILDQYMRHLEQMQSFDIEVTSDFVAMASQLLYIKSRMLLPKTEEGEEAEDPRKCLVDALIEYQRFKEVGEYFRERSRAGTDIFTKQPEPREPEKRYDYAHNRNELAAAMRSVFERNERKLPPPASAFSRIVGRESVSIASRVLAVVNILKERGRLLFKRLFSKPASRSEAVATFLAVLDLCKNNCVTIDDNGGDYELRIADPALAESYAQAAEQTAATR